MRIITVKRTVPRKRSIRRLAHDLVVLENQVEFAIKALLSGMLQAMSAWPIAEAAEAMNRLT